MKKKCSSLHGTPSWELKEGNGAGRRRHYGVKGCGGWLRLAPSLFFGAVRLCKWPGSRRARLSRFLTGRRVHNMSQTQPAREPTEILTENRGREMQEGNAKSCRKHSTSHLHFHTPPSPFYPPALIKAGQVNSKEIFRPSGHTCAHSLKISRIYVLLLFAYCLTKYEPSRIKLYRKRNLNQGPADAMRISDREKNTDYGLIGRLIKKIRKYVRHKRLRPSCLFFFKQTMTLGVCKIVTFWSIPNLQFPPNHCL